MHARGIIATRAKAARARGGAEAKGLERRRGLISFLTWAFVLSEMFGRDGLGPSSARASEDDEPSGRDGSSETAQQPADVADRSPTSLGETGDPSATPSSLAPSIVPVTTGLNASGDRLSQDMANAGRDALVATPNAGPGGGAVALPASSGVDNSPPSSDPAAPEMVATASPQPDASSLVQLSISPEGIFSSVAEIVDAVPLVGGVLSATVETVLGGVSELLHRGPEGALASGGLIVIEAGAGSQHFASLHSSDGYTDYGIALELDLSGGIAPSLQLAAVSDPLLADVVNLGSAFLPTPGEPGLSNEAGQRASGDLLA
ncbi:hypothetical protein [Hyphomicrobium sp.]|uniref:hypothetical protein n=1 Tax=Hyphomicrobium sp. TaxID=82 RepID=UPI002B9BCEA7|nr:hypothetical protein [Hyphomicrobium sp.]HRN87280.1 hypothetical protein [Hyphomicrobium sp.]HRQ25962.1 hypothetical protein [Hyphomicrobium sp.]